MYVWITDPVTAATSPAGTLCWLALSIGLLFAARPECNNAIPGVLDNPPMVLAVPYSNATNSRLPVIAPVVPSIVSVLSASHPSLGLRYK